MSAPGPNLSGLSKEQRAELFERLRQKKQGSAGAPSPSIPRRPAGGPPPPLSFAQQRLWFLDRLEPGQPTYNVVTVVLVEGRLEPAFLLRALADLIARHETLRTTFAEVDGDPVQVVAPAGRAELPLVDLSGLPPAGHHAEVARLELAEARRPFDLAAGPLLRATLLRLGGEEQVLLLTVHHIVFDGWSQSVLTGELGTLYRAHATGAPDPLRQLPELPVQYADFALWQRSRLCGPALEELLAYWRERLAGAPAAIDLPYDRPHPPRRTAAGAKHFFAVEPATAERLQAGAREAGATPFMVLLAGLYALLARYSGQLDLLVGSAVANRGQPELAGLIGFFVNTLVLRGDLTGDPTVPELIGRVRREALGAYAHQDLPFERLVEEVKPERDARRLGHMPLLQVVFTLQNAPAGKADVLPGVRFTSRRVDNRMALFDLSLNLEELGGRLEGFFQFSTDLFAPATVGRMADHLLNLLRGMLAQPGERLSLLPLLGAAERRQLLAQNAAAANFPWQGSMVERLEHWIERTPAAVALSSAEGHLTYAELDRRTGRLARRLRRLGAGPERTVALCLDRGLDLVVALLAVLRAGAAYVPLDPALPAERLAFALRDSGARWLLCRPLPADSALLAAATAGGVEALTLPLVVGGGGTDEAEETLAAPALAPANLAYVIYTSGSTGKPKGVAVTHGNLARLLAAARSFFDFGASDVWTLFHSYAFDFSVWEIWGALSHGGRLVVVPQPASRSPEATADLLAAEGVTVLNQTPAAFYSLIAATAADIGQVGPALSWVIFGGEALELRRLAPWVRRHGMERPRLVNLYGITETTVHVTLRLLGAADVPVAGEAGDPGDPGDPGQGSPIGRPVTDLAAYVLDAALEPVPEGVAGELYVGGAGVARGYPGRPELTAERFVPDPWGGAPGERLYKTGDRVRLRPDGELRYLGRTDRQVKLRGFRIELGEIESALLEHPAVGEAAVARVGVFGGEDEARLVAYVVPAQEGGLDAALLRGFLERKLPSYMVPAACVALAALPLSPNGKVDRRALAALGAEAAPLAATAAYVAPATETERQLAAVWSAVLGAERIGGIGGRDDFFALGGHSLLVTRAVARLRAAGHAAATVRLFFDHPVLADQAAWIDRQRAAEGEPEAALEPVPRDGRPLPLSFSQQQLWLIDRIDPGGTLYDIPAAIALDGDLDRAAFAAALAAVVERHEVLRTRFVPAPGGARQVIEPASASRPALPGIDLTGLAEPAAAAEAARLAAGERERRFDLERGPVLHAALVHLAPARHVLLLNVHHIAADGWSMGILTRDLAACYTAAREGCPPDLPALPLQYADYAWHQRRRLAGEHLAGLLAYWRDRLSDLPPPLPLPLDRPRAALRGERGGERSRLVPASVASAVLRLGEEQRATPFIALLAVFQALLARTSGQADLVLGTPVANRHSREVEELVGYFVNTLVLRTEIPADLPFSALLAHTRETALGAYAHQELPFETLVEALKPPRDLALSPFFQVLFEVPTAAEARPPELTLPGLTLRALPTGALPVKFDLSLALAVEPEGDLRAVASYARDLFDATTIERLLTHYAVLLARAGAEPHRPLAELELLSPSEHQQLVVEWNDTRADLPELSTWPTVTAWIESRAARQPEALAVSSGDEEWSYGRLDRAAGRLARRLRSLGVGSEARVGVGLERSPELIAALLAVLKAGGAYVPLDPAYPAERLAFLLADAEIAVLLTRQGLLPAPADPALRVIDVPTALASEDGDEGSPPSPCPALPDSLAYVIYTSGSTGRPKGVGVTHRNLLHSLAARRRVYPDPVEVFLPTASFAVDSSVPGLFWTLCEGGTIALPAERFHLDLPAFLATLRRRRVSHLDLVPALYGLVLEQAAPEELSSLRAVLVAGEVCPAALVERHRALLPAVRLYNEYGPTEGTVWCSAHECTGDAPGARVAVGRPIADARLQIVDAALRPLPIGAVGEIVLGGAGVARGYLGRPDLTAQSFVPDPWSDLPGGRLYRTGDRGRQRGGGEFEILGRADGQVKVRGFRVELGEIESALAGLPGVREAAVAALPGSHGGGDPRLVAYVAGEAAQDLHEIRKRLRALLPDHMVPAAFVPLPALPRTPSGKLDRRALPAAPAPPSPTQAEPAPAILGLAGRGTAEAIAAVWREVLGVPSVGLHDNFFDLGGHSLLLVEAHGRLRPRFPELTALDLFRYPTVAALAAHLTAGTSEEARTSPAPTALGSGDVAIVGMACRFPGAPSVEDFWRNLAAGVESIVPLSDEELARAGVAPAVLASPGYVRAAATLDAPDRFDAAFFGFTPREAEATDPQHRVFLECAWEALERAGYDPDQYPRQSGGRIGVYAGAGHNTYLWNLLSNPGMARALDTFSATVSTDKDFLTTRTSYKLGLEGPSVAVQTACSTSLVAVHLACRALLDGECDMALAGGVSIRNLDRQGYLYEEGGILSPDGHCRAFDARAQGTVGGDGAGVVVLKRLADALADGDPIDAVIKGTAVNNDGARKVGYTAPGIAGQARVVSDALARAGVDPATLGYVEAHGTGTPLGDPIEVAALTQVFRATTDRRGFCALGSVKTNVGHLDAAAGVAGLIKAALAVKHGVIPPSLHFTNPNPAIDFAASPFYVNTALTPWSALPEPRRAGVSSFGIGGTNAHVVLEQAPPVAPRPGQDRARTERNLSEPPEGASLSTARSPILPGPGGGGTGFGGWQMLSLSAESAPALDQATANLAAHLTRHPDLDLADVAHTLRVGRRACSHRRVVLCRDLADACSALTTGDPERVLAAAREAGQDGAPTVAFLLPGQGAQEVEMGLALYGGQPVFRAELDRAAEALAPELGLDLRQLLYPLPERHPEAARRLARTRFTQPALFAVEYALAQLWRSWGVEPAALLGHSVGELVAACLAGVLSWADALTLVALRGRLIDALPEGAMLSVPLPEEEVTPLLSGALSLAAVNAADRTVLSGPAPEVEELARRLAARGLEVRRLPTSHAFHSAMMEPAAEAFSQAAARCAFQPPRLPYLSNVTGTWIRPEEATDPAYWGRHLRQPVRFAAGLGELLAAQPGVLLEVGPGETLGRLARRELRRRAATPRPLVLSSLPGETAAEPEGTELHLLRTLGRLWLAGGRIDGAFPAAGRRRLPLPTYPFERRRYWVEPGQQLAAAAAAPTTNDLADGFYLPSWKRSLPPPSLDDGAELPPGAFLIFGDDASGLGNALAERLRQAGRPLATAVAGDRFARLGPGVYAVRTGAPEDYEALLAGLAEEGLEPAHVLHLWNAGPAAPLALDGLEAELDRSFYGPLFLLRALARRGSAPLQLWMVASHLHDVAGGETVAPARAALLGLQRVVPLELPEVICHGLDLMVDRRALDRILAEVAARPAETVVAYRGGQRWTQSFERVRLEPAQEAAPRLRPGGIYLVTGGLGGIGEAVARFLIETVAARVVLVGRTALPPGDGDAGERRLRRLRGLEEAAARAGGEVLYAAGDVADRARMEKIRELARARWGAVHGLVHAAGVPGGGLIAGQERERAAAVLAPKVHGTLVLAELFPPRELDFFVLCSSLAATLGGFGQADYCAANAFQEAFAGALAAAGEGGRTLAVAWDTWKDAGMAVDTAGAPPPVGLSTAEGIEALRRILARVELPQVLVSVRDLDRLIAEARGVDADGLLAGLESLPAAPGERQPRPELATAHVAPRSPVERQLAAIWEDLLGISGVGVHDDFFELGGDSVVGLRIVARARERGLALTPGQLFQNPTIASVAAIATAPPIAEPEPSPDRAASPGAAAPTPEDFPDAEISARDLATLLSQLGQGPQPG